MTQSAPTTCRRRLAPAGVRRRVWWPGGPVCATVWLVAACAPAERVGEGIAVDTLNGVVRVVNLASAPAAARRAGVLADTPLRIGRVEGDGPDVFGEIAALAVGPEGDIYVADGVALEIRVFSAAGEFLRTFGRQGEGPGEFEAIDGLVVQPDGTAFVRDPRLGRVSRFGPDGGLESSFRLERSYFIFSDGTTFWADSAGRVYDRITTRLRADAPERVVLVVYSPDAPTDTVPAVRYTPERVFAREGDRIVLGLRVPFEPEPLVAVSPAGEIATGLGDDYRIAVMSATGDTTRVFARQVEPDPVDAAAAASALDRMRARVGEMAPGATLDEAELPDSKPSMVRVYPDPSGGWWVGRYRGEADPDDPAARFPIEYDVFDRTGRLLGSVTVPPIRVFQIGPDYVAGVEVDELGVQYAVVYDLVRSG